MLIYGFAEFNVIRDLRSAIYASVFDMRSFCFALAMLVSSPALAVSDTTCDALIAAIPKLGGGMPLKASANGKTYKSLYDACDANDTFAAAPLPMHAGKRLTCSGDPNHVAYLNRNADGVVVFSAKAAVDADGSKLACGTGWPNQCGTWLQFDRGSNRKDVNAEDTSFVVVPGASPDKRILFQKDTGIGPGDLAVVFTGTRCSFGVVGDSGPYFRLGEISLRSHSDLGHPRCKIPDQYPCKSIHDVGLASDIHYIIFPNTRPSPLTSQNVGSVWNADAKDRLRKFLRSLK